VKGFESALWSLEHARSGHHGFRSAIARVAAELRRGSIETLSSSLAIRRACDLRSSVAFRDAAEGLFCNSFCKAAPHD
jgi:hypothetical protein